MKQVWLTWDGCTFNDHMDAAQHEEYLADFVITMYDREGKLTTDTTNAMILHLKNAEAAEVFINAVTRNKDDGIYAGIGTEEIGWFYWDEWEEKYHFIEDWVIKALAVSVIPDLAKN